MNKIVLEKDSWPEKAAHYIFTVIEEVVSQKASCTVVLTGGRSAAKVYAYLGGLIALVKTPISFFLGDERCVGTNHPDSNFRMIMEQLFPTGTGIHHIYQMYREDLNVDGSVALYEELLPDQVDVLLLGLGDDGHIASLFPGQETLTVKSRKILPSISPYNQMKRISISAYVIDNAEHIIVFASGTTKSEVICKVEASDDFTSLPAVLAKRGTWLLDN